MSPTVDFLFRLTVVVLFLALVAVVVIGRRLTDRAAAQEAGHDPQRCADCSALRHPANREAREALAVIPRQNRRGDR